MANPTTNFGWVMPTATDLVTDLPADFAVFGQGVDTSMAYLLGGTTGQILSKTSGTNMAFTWINNDQGDITGITATSPLTGGGSSGAITVGIQDATTSVKGSVQLSDSTSTTSSVLAATPTAVKSAYDLANGAIPKTLTTTTGDIIYASAANTPARLGIGSTDQILKVTGGLPVWATPAASAQKVIQVVQASYSTATTFSSASFTDTGLSLAITPTLNTSKILVFINQQLYILATSGGVLTSTLQIVRDATAVFDVQSNAQAAGFAVAPAGRYDYQTVIPLTYLDSPATTSSVTYKTQGRLSSTGGGAQLNYQQGSTGISVITLMEIGA